MYNTVKIMCVLLLITCQYSRRYNYSSHDVFYIILSVVFRIWKLFVAGDPPSLPDLMSQVARNTQTKWYEVGIQLKIDISQLDAFEQQTKDQMRLYSKVFDQWKKEQKVLYTWDTIINVLEKIKENETATAIRKWLGETTSSDQSSAALGEIPIVHS